MYNIMPNVVYERYSETEPYLIMNSGSIRDHLFQYDIYNDDIYTIMPFPNAYHYFPKLLGSEINCVVNKLNGYVEEGENPKYFTPFVAVEDQYYDVLTDDYNAGRVAEHFDACIARTYRPTL